MFGFGFALVPIYKKICETTGIYDLEQPDAVRNTQVDESRLVTIEFDANTRDLPWEFRPLQTQRAGASRAAGAGDVRSAQHRSARRWSARRSRATARRWPGST